MRNLWFCQVKLLAFIHFFVLRACSLLIFIEQNSSFICKLAVEKDKNNDPVFKIASPLSNNDKELRYGIFSFKPGKSESIIGGEKRWAGE